MQSNNPLFKRATFEVAGEPMTVNGAIQRTVMLTGMSTALAVAFYAYSLSQPGSGVGMMGALLGGIVAMILALITSFRPHMSQSLAIPFALMEGVFMGGISATYEARFPGLPLIAMAATFATTFGLLALYKANIIRATDKFKSVVISASLAIFALYIIQMFMSLFFSGSIPFLFDNGIIGLGFAAFVAIIASLNLILDFDLIERCAAVQAPKYMEWFCGIALLATLVWMYVSFLRLLGIIRSN